MATADHYRGRGNGIGGGRGDGRLTTTPDTLAKVAGRILSSGAPLALIDALPGTGKTTLLREVAARAHVGIFYAPVADHGGVQVIDLAPEISLRLDDRAGPLIVAASAERVDGLARWTVYGRVLRIGNADLFLPPDTPGNARHGGWPALAAAMARGGAARSALCGYLRATVLPTLAPPVAEVLQALSAAAPGLPAAVLPDAGLSDAHRQALDWLGPVVTRSDVGWRISAPGVAALFARAFAAEPLGAGAAGLLERAGRPQAAIRGALAAGHRRTALEILARGGGIMFGHLHGPDAAREVLDALGDDPDPHVTALRAMAAMKAGHAGHAGALLETVGAGRRDGGAVPELRLAHLLLNLYNDKPLGAATHGEYGALLATLAPGDHLLRGSVYNIALDDQIRSGRRGEAEATAARALDHYRRAGAPYLAFYIHMHLALMHLVGGRPERAAPEIDAAATDLAAVPFDTPQDARFVTLLRAQVAWEQGRPEPIAAFAETALDDFAFGELWPTIAAQALAFGAEALALTRGAAAARRYLEGWRVQMWRTRRFRLLIEQREIILAQNARRWHEARQRLEAMATRIGRVWMDSAGENLGDLRDPEDVAQALLWLRQQALERPRDRALADRLRHAAENPALSWRQARAVAVWQAWAARRQGRVGAARTLLAATLAACDARRCVGPVIEERAFVSALLADARMGLAPGPGLPVPRVLRTMPAPAPDRAGLSAQEVRAAALLAEGCSNKDIARDLRISLPTVKFHLRNLYRKLGVSDRRSAVDAARRAGVLGE